MVKHEKQTFTDRSLVIDGNEFIGCTFQRCEIIFAGGSLPTLVDNDFNDCRWTFDGPAARVIQLMTALYKAGGQALIEATFENIRGKPAKGLRLN